jgi:hypothetical protein
LQTWVGAAFADGIGSALFSGGVLLNAFGVSAGGDVNGDGLTDADDLALVLSAFGRACG